MGFFLGGSGFGLRFGSGLFFGLQKEHSKHQCEAKGNAALSLPPNNLQNSKTNIATFDIEALKAFLASVGDSIVAFQTDSIVKIHVHTLTPEKVLGHCRTFGEFLKVKIENMSLQHSSVVEEGKEEKAAPAKEEEVEAEGDALVYEISENGETTGVAPEADAE